MTSKSVFVILLALLLTSCQAEIHTTEAAEPSATVLPARTVIPATATPQPAPISQLKPGNKMAWVDGSELVYIPADEFVMGDGADNAARHTVYLNPYWMHTTEVSNAMYAACARAGVCKGLSNLNDPGQSERPVVGVNWEQAQAYCAWIQGRLPWEAEWERAAQGPDGTAYPWGDNLPSCQQANFGNCIRGLSTVGSYQQGASPSGVLNMAGNAAEWVGDWYDPNYYNDSPQDNPSGPAFSTVRTVRGGSFASPAEQVSVFARAYEWPKVTRSDLGFRCVVPTPILFPPFCQAETFIPASEIAPGAAAECQPPATTIRGEFCQKKKGYATLDIPAGARWQLETPGFTCTIGNVSAETDRLTCYGQGGLQLNVTICSAACFGDTSDKEPVCPVGYERDTDTGKCVYTLAPSATCPAGFTSLSLGDKSACVPAPDNQTCPAGQYFDSGQGACLPGSGQTGCLLFGLEAPETAKDCYQGCQAGYKYNATGQCCQSKGGGYPGCGSGYTYDESLQTCLPGAGLGGSGCVTVTLHTGACVDCGIYPNCAAECRPQDKTQTCIMR